MFESELTELRDRPAAAFLRDLPADSTYVVGGAVRDWLLGRPVADVDFLVANLSPAELETRLSAHGHVLPVESRNFGVFVFRPWDAAESFELALPRADHWTGLGYKEVETVLGVSVEEDLARRDFTVNAMALSLEGRLIDPCGGSDDARAGLIRAVGDPATRFREDPTRLLRGLRLACELEFEIEPQTWQALAAHVGEIQRLTAQGVPRAVSYTHLTLPTN